MASQPRTVYVGNVNASLDEQTIRALFQHCGNVTQVRIAGDPSYNTRYCFVEFSNDMEAMAALSLNGLQLADRQIKVSMAKQGLSQSPAQPMGFPGMAYGAMPGMYGFPMPGMQSHRAPKPQDQEKIARTIHVDNVDYSITEFHLAQFFGVCGTVTAVRIARSPGQVKHKAWVEFQTPAIAQAAFQLDNQVLGSLSIRVQASKSAIHTNGLQITPAMQQQMGTQPAAAAPAAAAASQPAEAASAPATVSSVEPLQEPAGTANPDPEEHSKHRRSRSRSPVRHQVEDVKPAATEEADGSAPAADEDAQKDAAEEPEPTATVEGQEENGVTLEGENA